MLEGILALCSEPFKKRMLFNDSWCLSDHILLFGNATHLEYVTLMINAKHIVVSVNIYVMVIIRAHV